MHAILIKWHPMLSADCHTDLMPVPPPVVVAPNPWHPHIVASVLYGLTFGKIAPTVKALNIEIIHMGSDIANGIPHIPLPPTHFLLALLYTAFSGSKSHFGPAAVQTKDGVVGAALLIIVQPNLNCYDVVPLPTGWVCAPNTVMAHMTLGDILGGFFAMGVDAALQALMNKAGGALNNRMGSQAGRLLAGPLATYLLGTPLGKTGLDGLKAMTPESWHGTIGVLSHIPGFPGSLGVYQGYLGDAGRGLGNIIGDGISGGNTPTDRLFGRNGSYATQNAPAATQSAPPVQSSTPLDGVTNNPSVEEF
jgi:hypothetical protein